MDLRADCCDLFQLRLCLHSLMRRFLKRSSTPCHGSASASNMDFLKQGEH